MARGFSFQLHRAVATRSDERDHFMLSPSRKKKQLSTNTFKLVAIPSALLLVRTRVSQMKNILLVSSSRTLKAGQYDVCVNPLFCCVQVIHPSGWILLGYSRAADEFYVIPKKRGGRRTNPPQGLSGMLELAKCWLVAEIEHFDLAWDDYLNGDRREPELTGPEARHLTRLFNTVVPWVSCMRLAA